MRGELNIRNEYRNAMSRAGLDTTAPSTPGTASSMRTNPPSYQRMHSNESNKGNDSKDNGRISDWLEQPSPVLLAPGSATAAKCANVSNRFRRASNPALNKHQAKLVSRQGATKPLLPRCYRHPPSSQSRHNIGNASLPPLPPMHVNSRSLDGLLDSKEAAPWPSQKGPSANATAEGLKQNSRTKVSEAKDSISRNDNCSGSKDAIRNATSRRSRSLDDLLDDEDDDQLLLGVTDTQSLENILENAGSKIDSSNSLRFSVSPNSSEKMCENEVLIVENSLLLPSEPYTGNESTLNDSGIQCDAPACGKTSDNSSLEDDTISNTISITSSTSDSKPNKTFLNKYIKKVKNMIKKWGEALQEFQQQQVWKELYGVVWLSWIILILNNRYGIICILSVYRHKATC